MRATAWRPPATPPPSINPAIPLPHLAEPCHTPIHPLAEPLRFMAHPPSLNPAVLLHIPLPKPCATPAPIRLNPASPHHNPSCQPLGHAKPRACYDHKQQQLLSSRLQLSQLPAAEQQQPLLLMLLQLQLQLQLLSHCSAENGNLLHPSLRPVVPALYHHQP
jgi:hypothetical protein